MSSPSIKIANKTYSVDFSFNAMRLLSKKLDYNSFGDVQQLMIDLKFEEIKTDLSFDQWDFLGAVVSAGIETHEDNKAAKISVTDCTEALFNQIEDAVVILQAFSEAVFKRLGKQKAVQPATRQKKK